MTTPESADDPIVQPPPADVEADSRFPSGPWKGFFLQPGTSGRHWMELILTFRNGTIRGEGRDRVGVFVLTGRYEVGNGTCRWTKRYHGRHDISYQGYNEGKGIWGVWEDPKASHWRGGFHIWPEAMGDPYGLSVAEEVEEPGLVGVGVAGEFEVGASDEPLPLRRTDRGARRKTTPAGFTRPASLGREFVGVAACNRKLAVSPPPRRS